MSTHISHTGPHCICPCSRKIKKWNTKSHTTSIPYSWHPEGRLSAGAEEGMPKSGEDELLLSHHQPPSPYWEALRQRDIREAPTSSVHPFHLAAFHHYLNPYTAMSRIFHETEPDVSCHFPVSLNLCSVTRERQTASPWASQLELNASRQYV